MTLRSAILFLSACLASAFAVTLRVATFNIGAHFTTSSGGVYYPDYSLGAAGTADHDSVRAVLTRINADVVALQEIHAADVTAGDVETLAASLDYPYVFIAPSTNTFGNSLRVAFLSRFPFLSQTAIGSPAGAKEMNRLIPAVKVDVPGTNRDPVLIAAHLKSGAEASDLFQRSIELHRLRGYLTAQGLTSADNFLVMGDFNPSGNSRQFSAIPASGLPGSFVLGPDVTFPVTYSTDPAALFTQPPVSRVVPRQLDGSIVTFPSSGSTLDVFLPSEILAARPLRTEIYNSALDFSGTGLVKSGDPPPATTTSAASDHLPLFGDFELDPALPYSFNRSGQTVRESFNGFPGTYNPYPWTIAGGGWVGQETGTSTAVGFRAYGPMSDPSLGFLAGSSDGTATARFINQSGSTLNTLAISYRAEQWRSANPGTADSIRFGIVSGGITTPLSALSHTPAALSNGPVEGGTTALHQTIVRDLSVPPGETFEMRFTFVQGPGGGLPPADVFINEFDYDDFGSDTGEFVEIVTGPGFTGTPDDVSLVLYNGATGETYGSHSLATFTAGAVTASGHRLYSKSIAGIQNGAPDGFALVVNGEVAEFLSYEGTFTATNGPAAGMKSNPTGLSQSGSEPEGFGSIGRVGSGGRVWDFVWNQFASTPYSPGQPNPGQTFGNSVLPSQGLAIDDLAVTLLAAGDSDGDGLNDVEEFVLGTDPADPRSSFMVKLSPATPSPNQLRISFPTSVSRTYTLQSSDDLKSWQDVSKVPGSGSVRSIDVPFNPPVSPVFYRLHATLD